MKAKALSVRECAWMPEECHLLEEPQGDSQRDNLCLPSIFRSKKVRPVTRAHSGPSYQVYHTARELLLQVLDRGAVRELSRKTSEPSEAEYAEALAWFSVVLQGGLSAGPGCTPGLEAGPTLDGWQGVLKRNSFQTRLLSLSRLEDGDKLDALSSFCSHVSRRYQALGTPGTHTLAVKKYQLSPQEQPCSLSLALLCDPSSGFIHNMLLYSPERLLRGQRSKTVVEQVVERLLRPLSGGQRRSVQLDCPAGTKGRLRQVFSSSGVEVHVSPHAAEASEGVKRVAHLQGWSGPALFPLSELRGGGGEDVFFPGLWAALHVIYINTFVLHALQSEASGGRTQLTEFSRSLASQLVPDSGLGVPTLPRLTSSSQLDNCGPALSKHRWNRPGVCGLDNSGNSCYLNAVLQCLCSTVPLVEHLLHQDTRRKLARSRCRVAEVFVRLLEEMWAGWSSSCAPVEARSVLCSILPQFNNYAQQDAQELLLFLLNALHDNLKKVAKRERRSSVRRLRTDQNRSCSPAAAESTIVSHLFEGQLSYVTVCMHCSLQAVSTQAFTMLSLPIPSDIIKCSIQDCLALFFQQSLLTGAEQLLCSVCGTRRETTVLTYLDKPPEILMLHLKRFGCKGRNQVKLRTNVTFSERLDLSPFLSGSPLQSTSYSSYSLYAVVNHTGNLNVGHYTALCLSALTRTWHCFDDSAVREVQDGVVQSPHAYMLLYSRKPFHKPKIHGL